MREITWALALHSTTLSHNKHSGSKPGYGVDPPGVLFLSCVSTPCYFHSQDSCDIDWT